ncbi:serine/threonine-protein phosphatase 6 regulatory subunit 2 isoform 2-T2 [Salvelinus alpinus]|uniref:serine/threonine-protein phosphatase 6 regulatory subunit 2-like isoform X2 n=1 Tax=Salvelinus alpinus TaxID=8036 RepID=UPI0039FBEEC1
MFWKFDLHTSSQLEALLEKEDVTLTELMEEEDVLQECKAQNRRLLVFLSQDTCMQELLHLITTEPPAGLEEIKRFKHPNIACELLTSDVGVINDKLGGEKPLLDILYTFLEQPPPLNPLLASFFSKTIGNLITRKTEQVIFFLRGKEGFLGLVLKHINTSAMMDLLLRLISCVDPAPLRQDTLNWLNEERLAQRLIELIHPGKDKERQSNASQTVCDIIRLSRDQANQLQENSEADPLLAVLESQECVSQLLDNMFVGESTESCIVYGTQVLLTLLEIRRPGVDGVLDVCVLGYERCVVSSILQAVQPHLKHYHQLLLDPPGRTPMLTSLGVLEVPLGNCRLHVARLMASLLQTTNMSYYTCFDDTIYNNTVTLELCRLQTINLLLDLFFKYTWNNFLHFQVELCVAAILSHSAQEERPQVGLVIQERPLVPLEDIPQASFVAQEKPMFPQAENPQGSLSTQEKPRLQQMPQEKQALPGPKPPLPSVPPDISTHNPLVTHLFQDCRLVQRILEAWEENDKTQAEGGMRRGYMGHLTRIANTVVCNMEKGPVRIQISSLITELPKDCRGRWESFVDQDLTETNRKNTVDLVSHNLRSSSEDDDRQSPFPKELSLQQTFSDYQIQQMTANFVDQFGFNDDEFSEHGDNISATFDRIKEINFNVDTEDTAKTAAFEACTKEKIQLFDDSEEEDIWEEREINYTMHTKSRTRFGGPQMSVGSAQSDGMSDTPDKSTGSDTKEGEVPNEVTCQTEHSKNISQTETAQSPGWAASFGEVNFNSHSSGVDPWGSPAPKPGVGVDPWGSPAPKPGVGVDPWGSPAPKPGVGVDPWGSPSPKPGVGVDLWESPAPKSGVGVDPWDCHAPMPGVGVDAWGSPAPQPVTTEAEKGWAKFTDFQPFCCSETGLRCTSPVDSEICGSDKTKPSQGMNPCVWSVCVARKAPLVASDTSSSGGSDSEEEEEKTESVTMEIVSKEMVTTEPIVTTARLETIRLNMNVKNERAGFTSVGGLQPLSVLPVEFVALGVCYRVYNTLQTKHQCEVDMKEKEKEKKRVMGGEDLLNATAAPLTDRPATVTKS